MSTEPTPQRGAGMPTGLAFGFGYTAAQIAGGPPGASLADLIGDWPALLVRSLVAAAVATGVYRLAERMTRPSDGSGDPAPKRDV